MTELLERAMATARHLPPERQDDVARLVLAFVGADPSVDTLTAAEEADLDDSDAEVARGEFATEEQMLAIWSKHGS